MGGGGAGPVFNLTTIIILLQIHGVKHGRAFLARVACPATANYRDIITKLVRDIIKQSVVLISSRFWSPGRGRGGGGLGRGSVWERERQRW